MNRGERRVLLSIVIELLMQHGRRTKQSRSMRTALAPHRRPSMGLARALLSESGLWTAIRMRPFGKVPAVDETPGAVFVTAIDSNPLSGSVEHGLAGRADFSAGLTVVAKLTEGKTYLCKRQGAKIPTAPGIEAAVELESTLRVYRELTFTFSNPRREHTLPGTSGGRMWSRSGICSRRVSWIRPGLRWAAQALVASLLKTRLGACLSELLEGELTPDMTPGSSPPDFGRACGE